jgi:AraC-like DNA-binding protein
VSHIHRITSGPLAGFVDFLWLSEGYAPSHGAERILPTGLMGLVLDISGTSTTPGLVSGARASSFILDTSKPLSLLGVTFKAGGGYPFVGLPAGKLQDLTVPLDTFWGGRAEELQTKLLEANTTAHRFRIVEEFLSSRLALSTPRSPLVQFALRTFQDSSGAASVGDVVERGGSSARRFIAEFRDQVGLPPKAFCRIARFRKVIRRVALATDVDWSDVALSCGYYDQAHFIHEFREFAGVSPSSYLRCRTNSPNHVLMPE